LTAAALVVYAAVLAAVAAVVWRRPIVALPLFVVGLAMHNAAMDALHAAGVTGRPLTAIQAWKEILLAVAIARVVTDAVRARRLPFRPQLADGLALAFAAIVVLYAVIPQAWLGGDATAKGVAYALRHDLTGVAAYALGRALVPDWRRIRWLVLATAAAVAVWGLIDVYAISLDWWRTNGTVSYFRDQLGYLYTPALSGLPENFVYNAGGEDDVLRRLVSTFLSPLASAYLCLVALLLLPRARAAAPFAALAAAGLLWTYTRAAIVALAFGLVVLALASRGRRLWPLAVAGAVAVISLAFTQAFPEIGPQTHYTRAELQWQRANQQQEERGEASATKHSGESHLASLREGAETVLRHPQGFGLGNAGEIAFRTGVELQAGESNYTEFGVEVGLLGVLLFIGWNVAVVLALIRAGRPELAAALAAILVVAIQTDAYGIPWLAACLWWLAGSGISSPRGPDRLPVTVDDPAAAQVVR
jgi:O-Antigen ligase